MAFSARFPVVADTSGMEVAGVALRLGTSAYRRGLVVNERLDPEVKGGCEVC